MKAKKDGQHCASHPAKKCQERFSKQWGNNVGNIISHYSTKTPVPEGQSQAALKPPRQTKATQKRDAIDREGTALEAVQIHLLVGLRQRKNCDVEQE